MAIGHTRYSTTGSSHLRNAQPFTVICHRGQIAIAHNGNLTNACRAARGTRRKRRRFSKPRSIAKSFCICWLNPTLDGHENNLIQTVRRIEGAYSLVIMTEQELIGVRDPHGFRPLVHRQSRRRLGAGQRNLRAGSDSRQIRPRCRARRNRHYQQEWLAQHPGLSRAQRRAFCIFEYVYFARPDSTIANRNVYKVRVEMGRELAREYPIDADIVIPVPDSGNCAALGYSLESGIPLRNGVCAESLCRPQLSATVATDPRLRCAGEAESDHRTRERQTGDRRG